MIRGFGCNHTPPGVKGSHRYDELCGGVRQVPASIDRSDLLVGERIMDQGPTQSCVRHALVRAIQLHAKMHGHPTFELPSARHLTRLTMAALGDEWSWDGTTFEAAIGAANGAGIARESLCPWVPDKDGYPDLYSLQCGLDSVGLRSHRLESEWDLRVWEIKNAIASGAGVVVGTDVNESFCRIQDDTAWKMTGTRLCAHGQAVLDYDEGALRFVGSYGPGWAAGGLVRVAWEHIADPNKTRSVWIIDVTPNWVGGDTK